MPIKARIIQESPVLLLGLSSREILERMLTKAGVDTTQDDTDSVNEGDTILLLRGDFLYDQRIIVSMIDDIGIILEANTPQGPRPVAAHVTSDQAERRPQA
jgi:hypothetical protein